MDKYYVFGHRNPDTDSVVSAISLAYLKRKLGYDAIPCVLSSINQETSYVLNYFNEKVPMFLNDVKTKVKDLDYLKDFYVKENVSIYEAFMKMGKNDVSKIPVVDKNRVLIGMLSMTSISYRAISENTFNIKTQYKDIINIIGNGEIAVSLVAENIAERDLIDRAEDLDDHNAGRHHGRAVEIVLLAAFLQTALPPPLKFHVPVYFTLPDRKNQGNAAHSPDLRFVFPITPCARSRCGASGRASCSRSPTRCRTTP